MTHKHDDTATPDLFADLPAATTPDSSATANAEASPPLPPAPPTAPEIIEDDDGNSILLHDSAARDYLEYAVAVVKGRALPDVKDGQKPVQRRVLFAATQQVHRPLLEAVSLGSLRQGTEISREKHARRGGEP